ncbi:uncharacterized protein B0H64DRAFT_439215 [Chaetomium fimeti]|uniref:Uncharacterized protein n=1 Tax=Chaetomium fimeti TaxID=1854472 RepID=A0AAE0LVF2_9PEZI|nr:hypothetical protein B0H64DRAFT_439215 [Chaetomium fimeti]
MRPIATLLISLLAPAVLGLAIPAPKNAAEVRTTVPTTAGDRRRSPSVEGAGQSGGDDDDAIAYAWYEEDKESA